MDLRLLEYFLSVCEELHFTKAAEKLGVSQPTLSQQIKLLEGRLGSKLFQMVGKKVHITQAGYILLDHTKRIFSEMENASRKVNELKEFKRGKLEIGCAGNHLIFSELISFNKIYPEIELSVTDMKTEEIINKVLNNQLDIGVVMLPVKHSKLEVKHLFTSKLILSTSVNHRFADKNSINITDLQDSSLFLLQKEFILRKDIDYYCKVHGIDLKPVVELSDMQSLLQMSIRNEGVTILPQSFLNTVDNNNIRQIPIYDPLPTREIGVIYRKDSFILQIVKAFIENLGVTTDQ